jgi:hypothetical protein
MTKFEFVSCRLAIQVCVGHFPDGRERHRTFSVKNIKPDADKAALLAVVRAIGSLLAYPVTKARLIVKERRVLFDVKSGMNRGEARERETKPCEAQMKSVFAESAEPAKIASGVCLFFKNVSFGFSRALSKISATRGGSGGRFARTVFCRLASRMP